MGDGETNSTDAGIEVKDFVGSNVLFDFGESHFVDGEIDLKEAVGRVRICASKYGVGEIIEFGMRFAVFVESAGNFAGLVATEKKGLKTARFGVLSIELFDDFSGSGENFGAFDAGACDGDFAVRTASMKGKANFARIVVPIERVFHFVAIMIILIVSKNFG